uniref:Cytochrome P450 family n=1 Tax=Paeonia suffruticosa TaxID=45171 RepID=A0AB38Z7E6_PAESU
MAIFLEYFLLFIALYFLTSHFLNKIHNLPPSPFPTLPIIGHLYLLKKPLHRTLSKISARYGPILLLRFGSRNVLLVSSPSAAEECLTNQNDVVFANRPRFLAGKHLGYNYTSLPWAPHGDHWRNLRRISAVEILSTHRLQMMSSIRADEVRRMIQQLYKNTDEKVEMKSCFFELTLNVLMRMIAGKRYYGEDVTEVEAAREFREIVSETFLLGGATNMLDFLPVLKWVGFKGIEKKMKVLHGKRDGFIQSLIEESRKEMKSRDGCGDEGRKKTMIEVLLTLKQTEPEYYTDKVIKSLILVILTAGTDTSSGTMEWALSLLVNNPQVLKKEQKEIDDHVGYDRLIDESDLSKLPYLHSIVMETLRMYPGGPMLVPHEASTECTVGGYKIPCGTILMINMWAIQNDLKIWTDPRTFKPERFEGFEGERDGFKLMPFGSGRRSCPGEGLAVRMVALALGSVIQCFEWERIGEEMVDMTEGQGLTLPKAHPLWAKCRPRSTMLNLLRQI